MRIKELRNRKGITQKDAAKYIGCLTMTYSRYENEQREPDIHTLCLLASLFETSVDDIIGCKNL